MIHPEPPIRLIHASRSVVGRRANNEDSHAYLENFDSGEGALVVVADGMGGHAAGEVASRIAVDVVAGTYASASEGTVGRRLARAVEAANEAVFRRAAGDPALAGMGTTLTALVLRGKEAVVAHVGDSRAYLFRNGVSTQLTRDHSVGAELGIPDGDDTVTRPPHAHMLTRALGAAALVRVDASDPPLTVQAGDVFLLCSDGLSGTVTGTDMAPVVSQNDPESAARKLVDLALERGGTDNVTVEIVRVEALGGPESRGVLGRIKRALDRRSSGWGARAGSEAPRGGGG